MSKIHLATLLVTIVVFVSFAFPGTTMAAQPREPWSISKNGQYVINTLGNVLVATDIRAQQTFTLSLEGDILPVFKWNGSMVAFEINNPDLFYGNTLCILDVSNQLFVEAESNVDPNTFYWLGNKLVAQRKNVGAGDSQTLQYNEKTGDTTETWN
ncbi:hypothetical protein C5B42_05495 [Candidatus Cerribacteria bacterium 'Amazon FNV 2010 28 9']|uniref:S9 family peptidase n=1 Tax=Candidatus Cerribacteria bacterium 'Amazon FNV 2010 28 9' TaxID=2081795 RepID=A0A317JRE3_9BACT|nr:MAG: hypothetical protein C5B42_05495 [Candidatus Cerribacteria bacterium 'Amazon FNV 2010 28 9']